jgi:hypothetical protein
MLTDDVHFENMLSHVDTLNTLNFFMTTLILAVNVWYKVLIVSVFTGYYW